MRREIKTIALVLFLSVSMLDCQFVSAQSPQILWTKTYGGSGNDWGSFVRQTDDGGFIITGKTYNYGAGLINVWLVKTNAQGDTLWTKAFSGNNTLGECTVQQTADGGYIITAEANLSGGDFFDVWLIKTDASGNGMWTRTYGGALDDMGTFVQQTSDGGYIVTGYTTHTDSQRLQDVWLIKTDASGDTLWTKMFGKSVIDIGHCVQQTSDGGYVIAGETMFDLWLIRTDSSGDTVWTKTFGGMGWESGKSVRQTSDGGYIVAGKTASYGAGGSDFLLVRTDASGTTLWTKTFGGPEDDVAHSVQQTSEGGYILAGETMSYGAGMLDGWLVRTDASGQSLWTQTFGGSDWDLVNSVHETSDKGLIVAGSSKSFGNIGTADFWLIRIAPDPSTSVDANRLNTVNSFVLEQNYPNPFNPKTIIQYQLPKAIHVRLLIYNLLGQLVNTLVDERKSIGTHAVEWDGKDSNGKDVVSGIYLYKLETDEFSKVMKINLLR